MNNPITWDVTIPTYAKIRDITRDDIIFLEDWFTYVGAPWEDYRIENKVPEYLLPLVNILIKHKLIKE